MVKKVDSLVVGSGAGGLAMALFLAQTGKKILLLEKSPQIGGALASFSKDGYSLDAGFHFTGALQDNEIFDNILKILNIRDKIEPIFLNKDRANIFNFSDTGKSIEFPFGIERIKKRLKDYFPGQSGVIDTYFNKVKSISQQTPTMNIDTMHQIPQPLKEDYITLKDYLDNLTDHKLLKEVLSAFIMCHGTPPEEVSLANNARLAYGFYESICSIKNGGASLVDAFLSELSLYDVEIIKSEEIIAMEDIKDKKVGRFILKSGIEVEAKTCIMTIPPYSILKLLPKKYFPPAFFNRIESFEYTSGFFTVFAKLEAGVPTVNEQSIISLYPKTDINALSLPNWEGPGALAILHSKSKETNIVTAFEPIYWNKLKQWSNSSLGIRPKTYKDWKLKKTEEIIERIENCTPSYAGKLKTITSATPLTYRDYLNHHQGAAYGIRQKIEQYNLIGQLRLRNIYCAGQSAILPGVLGTIMASLLVARNIIGNDAFKKNLKVNL
jgi:phytoene dehydrogenase-like protein